MEYLVVILLAIIAYQLYKLTNQKEAKKTKHLSEREFTPIKSPAFSEQEWNEAVSAWYEKQFQEDRATGQLGMPGYDIWQPPDYDEVKYDRYKLENLRYMAGLTEDKKNGDK